MLDHNHSVAHVSKLQKRVEQAAVVALVQADTGLVQHIKHTHQTATDLAGKTDTLPFAAGEGGGRPVEREIMQTHIHQELQAFVDLLEHFLADFELLGC